MEGLEYVSDCGDVRVRFDVDGDGGDVDIRSKLGPSWVDDRAIAFSGRRLSWVGMAEFVGCCERILGGYSFDGFLLSGLLKRVREELASAGVPLVG